MFQHITCPSIQQTVYYAIGSIIVCYFCVGVSLHLESDALSLGSWFLVFEMTLWPHLQGLKYLRRILTCFNP
jgi:hypothetical protein